MAIVKRVFIIVVLFLTPALVRADSFVSVTTLPTTYFILGGPGGDGANETIGVSFTWDVTTNVLSNFVVTQSGPLPTLTFSFVSFGPSFINQMNFSDAQGAVFSVFRENSGLTNIGNTPGTYTPLGLDLICKQPGCIEGEFINIGTAVVTSLGDGDHDGDDPVATPEPSTLVALLAGLGALTTITLLGKKA